MAIHLASNCGGDSGPGAGTEPVVVQGVADLVLITPTGAVIIDFKTDRSSQDQDRDQSNRDLHERQLEIYARAVEVILGVKVFGKWIYYLADGRAVATNPALCQRSLR